MVFPDAVEPSKGKEQHKTWKGKMVSRFVRNRSGSGTAVEMPDDQEVTGTFGVPLCDCPPSLFNEVCFDIVYVVWCLCTLERQRVVINVQYLRYGYNLFGIRTHSHSSVILFLNWF